jgi:ribosomal protein L18E
VQPGNTANTTAWKVDGSAVTQPVSGTVTATLGSGSVVAITGGSFTIGAVNQGTGGSSAWKVDGSAVTQPVSIATAPALVAGSAIIGKVGIDQTTPGTTNLVSIGTNGTVAVNAALPTGTNQIGVVGLSGPVPAGTNLIGKFGIDQTTPGTTNLVSIGTNGTVAVGTALPTGTNQIGVVGGSGSFTVAQATGTNLHTVVDSGTVNSAQSGTWTVQPGNTANTTAWKVDGSAVTQPVSGTVTVNALTNSSVVKAQLQDNSGAAITLGQAAAASSVPVVTQADSAPATQNVTAQDTASTSGSGSNGQVAITGTPTANSAASFAATSFESIEVQVTGTWTGTLATEVSMDGGTTWYARGIKQTGSSYLGTTFTANFQGALDFGGMTNFRVRATAAMTGTATAKIIASVNPVSIVVSNPMLLRDATTQSISNTIKAASTAAGASDTALVVAVSPNNTVATTQSGTWTVQPGNTANTTAWKVDGSAVTQPVSGTVTANLGSGGVVALTGGSFTIGTVNQGTGGSSAWKVDGSAVTQPVSGTVTINALTNSSIVKAQLQDNGGTAITVGQKAMSSSVPVTIASDQVAPKTYANSAGSFVLNTTLTTVVTETAPAGAVGFILEAKDANAANIRWAIGATATTTSGMQLQPGRDTGFIPVGANVSVVAESGTLEYQLTWIKQ